MKDLEGQKKFNSQSICLDFTEGQDYDQVLPTIDSKDLVAFYSSKYDISDVFEYAEIDGNFQFSLIARYPKKLQLIMKHAGNLICDTDVIRNCGVISHLPLNFLEYKSAITIDENRILIGLSLRNKLLVLKFQSFTYLQENDYFIKNYFKSSRGFSVTRITRYCDFFYAINEDILVRFQTDL